MSLFVKYTAALALMLLLLTGLFVIQTPAYAQATSSAKFLDISSQEAFMQQLPIPKQVPIIDTALVEEATRHTRYIDLCPKTNTPLVARCFGEAIIDEAAAPFITTKPAGFGPAEFRKAYNISGKASGTPIVAIVDAYDQPHIFSDLQIYSSTFNLPQLANCKGTIKNSSIPCLKKVNQSGRITHPATDPGWALEISLDVEAVHAMCDNCSILLVEATSPTNANLLKAVDTAISLGATIISNSYGSSEVANETSSDKYFNKPGIAIFASSGDSGYGVSYPAASQYVIAVGGTKLNLRKTGSYSSESAWSDGGSGCSLFETKPTWQHDTGCKDRTVADIAADADPTSGAAVYDSVTYNGKKGWFKIGGTSLASPLVAGIFATGDQLASNQQAVSFFYGLKKTHFHDITRGSNGTCSPTYLCKARKGYDGPTGLGSPKGAF